MLMMYWGLLPAFFNYVCTDCVTVLAHFACHCIFMHENGWRCVSHDLFDLNTDKNRQEVSMSL